MQPVIIVDIDGTLNYQSGRFESYEPKNDQANVQTMAGLRPVPRLLSLLHHLSGRYYIVLMSARPNRFSRVTTAWLNVHGARYDMLALRPNGNVKSDAECKREMYKELRSHGLAEPDFVIEDRPEVVAMWRTLGLVVFQIHPGEDQSGQITQ